MESKTSLQQLWAENGCLSSKVYTAQATAGPTLAFFFSAELVGLRRSLHLLLTHLAAGVTAPVPKAGAQSLGGRAPPLAALSIQVLIN